jgi:hypothetical protein
VTGSRVKLGAWVVSEDRNRAFEGATEVDNPLQERTRIVVPLLTLDVRLTEYLGVQIAGTFPDVTRTAVVPSATTGAIFRESLSGLGDTSMVFWYRPLPVFGWNVVLNFGASLPTGKTEQPGFRAELDDGNLVPTHRLQRGSGTLDPLFGASVNRRFESLTVFGSIAARTPYSEDTDGLRTGASAELNWGVAREIGTHRLSGFTRVEWIHRAQDVFQGTPTLEGGGNWLYVTPGVAVQVGKSVTVQGELKLPVYRALANKQLDSPAIFQFGISRAF